MSDIFKCTGCGVELDLNEVDFDIHDDSTSLKENATMSCPVCKSKFSLSAVLTEPGNVEKKPGEEMPPEELEKPEGGEEVPGGEGAPEVPGAEAGPGGGEATAGTPEQITAKESISTRIDKALSLLKEGKEDGDVMSVLLKPMKVFSLKSIHRAGLVNEDELDENGSLLAAGQSVCRKLLRSNRFSITGDASNHALRLHRGDPGFEQILDAIRAEMKTRELTGESKLDEARSTYDDVEAKMEHLAILLDRAAGLMPDNLTSVEYGTMNVMIQRLIDYIDEGLTMWESKVVKNVKAFLSEKKDEDSDEWTGDFANFNSKLYSVCKDLNIPIEQYEKVILSLQEKEAIELKDNKVILCLKTTKQVFVDCLKAQTEVAKEQASTVDLREPPREPSDLGSAPIVAPVQGSITAESEAPSVEDEIEKNVEAVLRKYFI